MAAEASEDWSLNSLEKTKDNWRATRGFTVIGASSVTAALAANLVSSQGGGSQPTLNDSHPENSRLKCDGVYPSQPDGPLTWTIRYTYSIPEDGDDHVGTGVGVDANSDPLLQPPVIEWGDVNSTEEIEADRDGNAILMSSRRPPAQQVTKRVTWKEVSITRAEPYFNIATSNTYTDTVNDRAFVLKGGGTVGAGEMYCASILPSTSYSPTALYVYMRYRFWIRSGGFQLRILDQDTYKYLDADGGQTVIRDENGVPVTEPKLLDGTGAVLGSGDTGIGAPEGGTAETTDYAVFLNYNIYTATNFDNLKLF